MYKRKQRKLTIIRKSCITGKAVWVSHERSYKVEWQAYKDACQYEINRMRQWANVVKKRKKNIMKLLSDLTANMPILGEMDKEKRDAAKVLLKMAEEEPSKQSDFYDHICEEKRQKRNAKKREKRWQEKYGKK